MSQLFNNKQRLFFALDISTSDKTVISQWWQQQNINNVSPITPANYHITLAFLGIVDEQQKNTLIELVTNYSVQTCFANDYPIELEQLAYFKKPQVAYLTLTSFPEKLEALANFISNSAKAIGLFQEERPYLPHISIARKVKNELSAAQLNHTAIINSFSLYLSQSSNDGVKYTAIRRWELKKKFS